MEILCCLLDGLVKNLGNNDFKYLSQEFDSKILDFVKQKVLYPHEYISGFELPSKEMFYSLMTDKKLVIKSMCMLLRFWIDLK